MAPSEAGGEFLDLLFGLLDHLEEGGIEHLITGALVRNAFGQERTTQDFDIVIHPDQADPEALRELLGSHGYEVEGPTRGDLGQRLILRFPAFWIDLWLAPDTPLHRGEFERAVRRDLQGREIPLLHPQDFVLRKLVNTKVRRASHDLDDAYQVLLFAWEMIDADQLIEDAAIHRVQRKARELVDLVRSDREELERGETPEDI